MIIVIFGPVAAGKTTIAKSLKEHLEGSFLVSSDQFKKRVYKRLIREVRELRGEVDYLIVDGTFYKRRWREELRAAAEDEEILEVLINCSIGTCVKRNRERSKPVPEAAIHAIYKEFERPKHFDLEIDAENLAPEEAVRRIMDLINRISE